MNTFQPLVLRAKERDALMAELRDSGVFPPTPPVVKAAASREPADALAPGAATVTTKRTFTWRPR